MIVRTSMDVDVYNVGIHGWANNRYRTTNCLPSVFHDTIPAQVPMQSRLPNRPQTPKDDVPHLHPREFLALATPRETNSFHL